MYEVNVILKYSRLVNKTENIVACSIGILNLSLDSAQLKKTACIVHQISNFQLANSCMENWLSFSFVLSADSAPLLSMAMTAVARILFTSSTRGIGK